jgi:hypothetical protein
MTIAFYMNQMLRDRSAVASGCDSLSRSAPADI